MWKCLSCERENEDTIIRCQCGFDHTRNYGSHITLTPLSRVEIKWWEKNQSRNKYIKEWSKWSESIKKELLSLNETESEYFLNEMQKSYISILDKTKNLKKEGQRLNEEGDGWYIGKNKNVDYDQAISCYRKAAELGNSDALNNLGMCYFRGHGVLKNDKTAFDYFKQSADMDNTYALHNVGYCYQIGRGVAKDTYEAFKWYLKSAKKGYTKAQRKVGDYYFGQGYINTAIYTVYDYMKEAVYWYEQAANGGDLEAQRNLGYCYRYGKGVKMHKEKAAGWYEKAALQGDVISQKILAELYQNGEGVNKDEKQANIWRQRAMNNKK